MNKLQDTYIATDFFDASINRICAWVIGLRNTRKAIMAAMLQPNDKMKAIEAAGLTGKETIIDAYCGTGTIGLACAKFAKQVIGVEVNKDAVKERFFACCENVQSNVKKVANMSKRKLFLNLVTKHLQRKGKKGILTAEKYLNKERGFE